MIAQYTPEHKDTYQYARTLAYRARPSAGLLIDAGQLFFFGLIGVGLVAVIMGVNPELYFDWEAARVLGLALLLGFVGLLLWLLFSIWSLAPSMDEPESSKIKISKTENGLHFSSYDFEVSLPFDKIILYFVNDHFIAIKQRYCTPITIDIRTMAADDVLWVREKLEETADAMSFWNAYKMLAG